jgi:hypothetical protein
MCGLYVVQHQPLPYTLGSKGGTITSVSIFIFFGEGRVKPLWVFEFLIITLHLQLVLNFNCSPKGGV